ncbi:MAG: hypothetical protein AB8B55_16320 [Mariniblastus sp.]
MSIDNGGSQFGMDNPIGNVEKPKSKGKFWLFGGCGCLTLIALVCIGGGAFSWFSFIKPNMDFMVENTTFVTSSEKAKEILGDPITMDMSAQSQEQNGQSLTYKIPVSGPKASGTYVLKVAFNPSTWVMEREEIYLEVDGVQTSLDPDEMFEDFEGGIDDGN